MPIAPGTRLGPYVVNSLIFVGGMGEVYRAADTNLARSVAIKVLRESMPMPSVSPDSTARQRRSRC
jgi:serine/threonine protein kinase